MDVTARYTLWRDGAGGSVTLYQSSPSWPPDSPQYWYVSVVWQPHAEPPDTTVDPDETPDTRPVPSGPAAAREVAEFLVPAELVPGYEMVMALATAANAMDRQISGRPDPADRRPDGLTLVPDEDGHLYAADVREPVLGVVEPSLVPVLETGATLIAGAPMVVEALSGIRNAPVRPPADRYTWLFTGLDPEQLATTRDACWRIFDP